MDIGYTTFEQWQADLKLVSAAIREAEFCTIDVECSGLTEDIADLPHRFDDVETRYQKLLHGVNKYTAFLVGICCFIRCEGEKLEA